MTPHSSQGAKPPGTEDESQAARSVRGMFAAISRRYDLLNHLLSFNADRGWRRRTVQRVEAALTQPGARVLDLCCGTGDLTLDLEARRGDGVWGCDFCHSMLVIARSKIATQSGRSAVLEADALHLPFPDASLDVITAAFGFRNLANYREGLAEMVRVLRPGGTAAILEFSQPPSRAFASLYDIYSRSLMPFIGGVISGSREAYTYLPDSVRHFLGAEELAREMHAAGFRNVTFERMTAGIVALHIGTR